MTSILQTKEHQTAQFNLKNSIKGNQRFLFVALQDVMRTCDTGFICNMQSSSQNGLSVAQKNYLTTYVINRPCVLSMNRKKNKDVVNEVLNQGFQVNQVNQVNNQTTAIIGNLYKTLSSYNNNNVVRQSVVLATIPVHQTDTTLSFRNSDRLQKFKLSMKGVLDKNTQNATLEGCAVKFVSNIFFNPQFLVTK